MNADVAARESWFVTNESKTISDFVNRSFNPFSDETTMKIEIAISGPGFFYFYGW